MEYQYHFGRKFSLNKTGYFNSTTMPRIMAHRWVWINHYGIPPKNMHIHHKDDDKSNNNIENLQLIDRYLHLRLHKSTQENKHKMRKLIENIRPMTDLKWRNSPRYANHILLMIDKSITARRLIHFDKICLICGKSFTRSLARAKFCSGACKTRSYRISNC
jgi:hypothetical protein